LDNPFLGTSSSLPPLPPWLTRSIETCGSSSKQASRHWLRGIAAARCTCPLMGKGSTRSNRRCARVHVRSTERDLRPRRSLVASSQSQAARSDSKVEGPSSALDPTPYGGGAKEGARRRRRHHQQQKQQQREREMGRNNALRGVSGEIPFGAQSRDPAHIPRANCRPPPKTTLCPHLEAPPAFFQPLRAPAPPPPSLFDRGCFADGSPLLSWPAKGRGNKVLREIGDRRASPT